MCELFYMRSKHGEAIPRSRLRKLLMAAEEAAHSNPDGFGAFNQEGIVFKTGSSLSSMSYQEVEELVDDLHGSSEVILHLRMATTGSTCKANAHPFQHGEHCMAHNGVMHGLDESDVRDSTDSEDFLRQTAGVEEYSTVDKLEESLENTRGTLSIFWRDMETGTTYYFRNRASFTFAETKEEVLGATRGKRLRTLDDLSEHARYAVYGYESPDEGMIYRMPRRKEVMEPIRSFSLGEQLSYSRGGVVYRSGYSNSSRSRYGEPYDSDEEEDSPTGKMVSTREYRRMNRPEYEQKTADEEYQDVKYSDIPHGW